MFSDQEREKTVRRFVWKRELTMKKEKRRASGSRHHFPARIVSWLVYAAMACSLAVSSTGRAWISVPEIIEAKETEADREDVFVPDSSYKASNEAVREKGARDAVQKDAKDSCAFSIPFPSERIISQVLVYKNEGDTEWTEYSDGVVLNEKSQLAARVRYANLSKAEIAQADEGKYVYPMPRILESTEDDIIGGELTHTDTIGGEQHQTIIGAVKSCPANPDHVHVHMDRYANIIGEAISEGTFFVSARLDLDEYFKDSDPHITVGDTDYILTIDPGSIENGASADNFSKDLDTSAYAEGMHRLDDGRMQADFVTEFTTGANPFPDAIIDDFMTSRKEVCWFVPSSMRLIEGEDGDEISLVGNQLFQIVLNPQNMMPLEPSDGYEIGTELVYENFQNQSVRHPVPADGFSVYLGLLKKNTRYRLKYSIIIDTSALIGGKDVMTNNARLLCSQTPKTERESADAIVNSRISIKKTFVSMSNDQQGNLLLNFSVLASAPADNDYRFENIVLNDMLGFQKYQTDIFLKEHKDKISVVPESVELYKAIGRAPGLDDLVMPAPEPIYGLDKGNALCSFSVGEMEPGEQVKLNYQVRLDKTIREVMALEQTDALNFRNEAYIRNTSDRVSGQYFVNSIVNTKIEGTEWMEKVKLDEKIEAPVEVSMNGKTVYARDGTQLNIDSFVLLPLSFGYRIAINEENTGDVFHSRFTDTLSLNDEKQTDYGYTGFVQVDLYAGARMPNDQPADTVFIQLPEGEDQFEFVPADYPAIRQANEALAENVHLSFELKYYVKPMTEIPVASVLSNTITGADIGIGNGVLPFEVTKKVTSFTASDMHLEMDKVGLCVRDPDQLEEGYPYGSLVWLIRMDGRLIPSGTVVHDDLGRQAANYGTSFRDDAVIGVYKSTEDFSQAPFSGFDRLQANDPTRRDPQIYDKVFSRLEDGRIDPSSYSISLSGTNNTVLDLEFEQHQMLDEDEHLYIALRSAINVAGNVKWHYDRNKFSFTFNNTSAFRMGTQSFEGQSDARIPIRNYCVVRKNWGETFTWNDDGARIMDTKQTDPAPNPIGNVDLRPYTNRDVMKPILDEEIRRQNLEMKKNSAYVDWRISTNPYSTDARDQYPNKGTFVYVDELDASQEYTGCFLTRDADDTVSYPLVSPVVENVQVTEVDGHQKVRIEVSGIQLREKVTLHIITRCTTDWNTLIGQPEDNKQNLLNTVKVYNCDAQISYSQDTLPMEIKGALYKGKVQMSDAEKKKHGPQKMKFEIILNENAIDLIPNVETITLIDTYDRNAMRISPEDIRVADGNGSPVEGYKISYSDEGNMRTIQISNLPDEMKIHVTYFATINALPGQTVSVTNRASWIGIGHDAPVREVTESFTYAASGDSVSTTSETLVLSKIDQDDAMLKLSGAEFRVEEIRIDDHALITDLGVFTTGEDGMFRIDENLKFNALYRITEIKAPEGYIFEPNVQYAYFDKRDEDGYIPPENLPAENMWRAQHGQKIEMHVFNRKPRCSLSIEKSFGTGNPAVPGTYMFGVYKEPYQEGMEFVKTGSITIEEGDTEETAVLAITDLIREGKYYVYELNEQTLLPIMDGETYKTQTHTFEVRYPDGNEIDPASDSDQTEFSVAIVNAPGFVPPETGGRGTDVFITAGLICLICGGVLAVTETRRRH